VSDLRPARADEPIAAAAPDLAELAGLPGTLDATADEAVADFAVPAGPGAVWTGRRARWLLVGLHLPFVVLAPLFVIYRRPWPGAGEVTVIILLAAAAGLLQLRHSLAAAEGRRPAWWPLTFLAIVALCYGPMWVYNWDWSTPQWFVVSSGLMLLRGRLAVAVAILPMVGTAVLDVRSLHEFGVPFETMYIVWPIYQVLVLLMGTVALVGSVRLVRAVDQLREARLEMAELAVGRERLRVSRDLHDLLGQSLSAVSLKGDLALRLLQTDADAARAEIESLTEVARGALRDVRAVAKDEHAVSLRTEVAAAEALLSAAGIDTAVAVDLDGVPPRAEQVLAWAVREAATNVLRHSDATACQIVASREGGRMRLVVANDGVRGPAGPRRGLGGLGERAAELVGAVATEEAGGRFTLVVEIPEEGE
jgi:two-component system sensor histidine kinase DesK